MLRRVKINLKYILSKLTIIATSVFSFLSIIQLFFDWHTLGIDDCNIKAKLIILTVSVLICIIIALVWGLISSKALTILSKDNVKIIIKYGDLMKIAFPKKKQQERIVVIAVNCCYDTIVNDDIIHEGSVHGQFLNKYVDSDRKRHMLDAEIEKSLNSFGFDYKEISKTDKREGKRKR